MMRILALLCSLAVLLAPLGTAQAEPACAMLAVVQDTVHPAPGADHQMPMSGQASQSCKQLCAVVAILVPPELIVVQPLLLGPSPRPVARMFASLPSAPSERPPKHLI